MRAGFLALLSLAAVASAHNKVTHFHVNGVADTKCVRQSSSTDPIADLMSPDMACNAVSETTADKCEVQAGDEVAFEYRAQPDKAPEQVALKDGSIKVGVTDDSHKGPCAVYAKKVDDSATAEGPGDGWFKLSHDGVENGEFCTTRLNNADAPLKATIPKSLAPGDYLLRAEILTLNNAAPDNQREPQFYPGCVQVTISGGDSTANPETVSIPGYLEIESPGLLYNIWTTDDYSNYEIPGPAPLAESATPVTETPDNESAAPEEPAVEEPEVVEEPEAVEEPEVVAPEVEVPEIVAPEVEIPEIIEPEIEVPEIIIPSPVPEPSFSSATIIPTTTFTTPQFTDTVNPSDLPTASPLLPSPTLAPTTTAEVAYPTFASDPLPPVSSQVNYTTTVVTVTGTRPAPGTAGTGAPAAPTPVVPGYKWKYWKKYGGRPRGRGGSRRGGN